MNHLSLRRLVSGALLVLLVIGFGCDSTTDPDKEIVFPASNVSYSQSVQPFFNVRCATYGCHDDQTQAGRLSLTSYVNLTTRPGIVIPGSSTSSLLIQRIDGRIPHPINVPIIVNQNQLDGIKKWIDEGARNN